MAARYLSEAEASALYLQRAGEFETMGHYKDAEKLYLEAREHDLAIDMYKKARQFDHMICLVAKYRRVRPVPFFTMLFCSTLPCHLLPSLVSRFWIGVDPHNINQSF